MNIPTPDEPYNMLVKKEDGTCGIGWDPEFLDEEYKNSDCSIKYSFYFSLLNRHRFSADNLMLTDYHTDLLRRAAHELYDYDDCEIND